MSNRPPPRHVGLDWKLTPETPIDEHVIVPDDHGSVTGAQADALWFEQHPGVNVRFRAPTPGEVETTPVGADWRVIVFQLKPGVRLRRFLPPEARR